MVLNVLFYSNCVIPLKVCLQSFEEEFVEVLRGCSGVVVARCSPTQKARVARLLRRRALAVAAVGDGGNDVAMIQEADIGQCTSTLRRRGLTVGC